MVTEILVNGKIYRLETDDAASLRETAAALDERLKELSRWSGFGRLDKEQKVLFAELSLTDELLRSIKEKEELQKKLEAMDAEIYSLRHDVVSLKMQLEQAEKVAEASSGQDA